MEHLILLNFLTVAVAISAFTYSSILTDRGMLLHGLNNRLDEAITGRFRWVYKILIGCQFCVAGQWALWYFIYFSFTHGSYFIELHIWFIMQTIFLTKVVTYIYYKMEHKSPAPREEIVQLPAFNKNLTTKK
jgi:hypothetical protein